MAAHCAFLSYNIHAKRSVGLDRVQCLQKRNNNEAFRVESQLQITGAALAADFSVRSVGFPGPF